MAESSREYLNVRETARRLGVHENTIRNWSRNGTLHAARLPGSGYRRFKVEEVDQLARQIQRVTVDAREA